MEDKGIKNKRRKWPLVLVILLMIPVLIIIALSLPSVQTLIAKRVAAYLTQELKAEVAIEKVRITLALNAMVKGVTVKDREGQNLLEAPLVLVDVKKLRFRKRRLEIGNVIMEGLALNAKKYQGQGYHNFQFLIDFFKSKKPDEPDPKKWTIKINAIDVVNSGITYNDLNHPSRVNGFDPLNFSLSNISLSAGNLLTVNDTIAFDLMSLSFNIGDDFVVRNLNANFFVSDSTTRISNFFLKTLQSQVEVNATLDFDQTKDNFLLFEDLNVDVTLNNSQIDLKELGYLVSSLKGIEGLFTIEGNFNGKLSNLRGNDIFVSNSNGSHLKGKFHITGLPNIGETFFMVKAEELKTSIREISSFKLPLSSPTRYLAIPEELKPLDKIFFGGNLTGFLDDFVAFGNFNTSIGKFSTDLLLKRAKGDGLMSYSGRLLTNNLDLGKMANFGKLGMISMDARLKGVGATLETAKIEMTGLVKHLELFDYNYENIAVSGDLSNRRFNGALNIDDPNVMLDFNGIVNFEEAVPNFKFNANLKNANLTLLNIFKRKEGQQSIISGLIEINASASTFDNWVGRITVNDLNYEEILPEGGVLSKFESNFLQVENKAIDGKHKEITLKSDFLDASMKGTFRFDRMINTIESFAYNYLPALLNGNASEYSENSFAESIFEINLKDINGITKIFLPFLQVGKGATIYGNFGNSTGDLTIEMDIPEFSLHGNLFTKGRLSAGRKDKEYIINSQFESVVHSKSLFMENFRFSGTVIHNTLTTDVRWNNTSTSRGNYGNIVNQLTVIDNKNYSARILPSYLVFNDGNWFINTENQINIGPKGIEVSCIELQGDSNSMLIDGIIGPEPEDQLILSLDDIDVNSFWGLVEEESFDFDGTISGIVSLNGLMKSTGVSADIKIKGFEVNNTPLGNLTFNSFLDKEYDAYRVKLEIINSTGQNQTIPFEVSGSIFTNTKGNNFDLSIDANNLELSIWQRFIDGAANNLSGKATGSLKLVGPFNHPQLLGRASITQGSIELPYLNTTYSFADEMVFNKEGFVFNNVRIEDIYGNRGTLNGIISNTAFDNWGLSLDVGGNNLLVMNLPQDWNSLFFGTAFASGNAKIFSTEDGITVEVKARSNKGTQVIFPMQEGELIQERNFISFINRVQPETPLNETPVEESLLTLKLDLEVTPDAELQLVLNSRTGEVIQGRGEGNIKVDMEPDGDFSMFGDLLIQEGEYIFKFQGFTWRFIVDQGGTITWLGHPLDAEVDIKGKYQLKASLFELFSDFADLSDAYRRRVPVEVDLFLTGKLFPSTLSFGITIPGAGEEVNNRLEEIISTDQELTTQVFSLLILQRFLPAGTNLVDATLIASGSGLVGTTTDLFTNQINNWLSQLSKSFDIGIKYRPGDNVSGHEIELVGATRLFDNRLAIDLSLGYAESHTFLQRTSNIIGDVNVEYKLTPRGNWRLKAFNRTNTFDIERLNTPYTQGVGIFFRKEFDRLSELFRARTLEMPQSIPQSNETKQPNLVE